MYKKYMAALLLINLIALAAVVNLTELKVSYVVATEAFHLNVEEALMPKKRATGAARPYPYRQRRKDGSYVERWKVELSLGKGPDGKYRTKQITASTFRECERKLKEARERLNRTGRVEAHTGGLVRDYTAMFINDVEHRLSPGTVKQYKRAAWYIDKRIGDMNASDVLVSTARMVQDAPDRPSPAVRTVLSQSLD